MKFLAGVAALTFAAAVSAQSTDSSSRAPRERAPLATVGEVDPAVDVGASRLAVIDRPAAPKAPAVPLPARPAVARPVATAAPVAAAPADTKPGATPAPRAGNPRVLDSLDLGTTSITGNQELPKVLYIVPWKKSDLGDLVGRPVNTLLDEVLAPVDPEVFERHLEYYDALYGQGLKE